MNQLIGTQSYCAYRGRKYIEESFGKDRMTGMHYVTIPKLPECVEADFPDALEFGGNGDDGWIKLPVEALSRRWREYVYGLWHGVQVEIHVLHKRGQSILYCYTNDHVAREWGLSGNQYDGWQGAVSPDEVQLTYIEIHEYPINPPGGVIRSQDVKVVKIPFSSLDGATVTKVKEE